MTEPQTPDELRAIAATTTDQAIREALYFRADKLEGKSGTQGYKAPPFNEDPPNGEAWERYQAELAKTNGHVEAEPAWLPDEERGKSDKAAASALRAELLRGMLLTPGALAALPPPAPLISGYLTRGSLAATYGRPGTAKSFIAISMALAVVTGTPWFGREVHRGPVLYVAGEGTSGLAQRQRAWQDACGIDDLEGMFWLPWAVNLLQPDWSRGLAELAADLGAVLVVIDTLARSMVGADENRSGDMAAAVEACDVIRRLSGATVDLVHHSPKATDTLRGHSALEGAVDTALLIERSEGYFTLTAAKQKDIPQVEPFIFELELQSGSCVPTAKESQGLFAGIVGAELALKNVLGTMAGTDGLTTTQWLDVSKMSRSSFFRAKKNLEDRGVTRNSGTSGRPRWSLVEEGPEPTVPTVPNSPTGLVLNGPNTGGSLEPGGLGLFGDLDLEEEF